MAEAGRSLKRFYVVLGLIAVAGIALIVRAATSGPGAALVLADCSGPPLGNTPARGQALGPDSAPVHIVEYADFECPLCAKFAILTMPDVQQRLIPTGRLHWEFVDFPLQQHVNSPLAHVAAACAADQGRFWEMEYALYDHQDDWFADSRPDRKFRDYARGIGLNADAFQVCLTQRRHWPTIEANRCQGEKAGVNGTPTVFVNGRPLPFTPAFDDLTKIVDSIAGTAPARTPAARR
ncbi:MAG TPA: thioredoxin domain-containing protein [Gemmatimonadales bacterium]|nr:thioredoxin domain-containing protein [Gemmatimonadales bacterium]